MKAHSVFINSHNNTQRLQVADKKLIIYNQNEIKKVYIYQKGVIIDYEI